MRCTRGMWATALLIASLLVISSCGMATAGARFRSRSMIGITAKTPATETLQYSHPAPSPDDQFGFIIGNGDLDWSERNTPANTVEVDVSVWGSALSWGDVWQHRRLTVMNTGSKAVNVEFEIYWDWSVEAIADDEDSFAWAQALGKVEVGGVTWALKDSGRVRENTVLSDASSTNPITKIVSVNPGAISILVFGESQGMACPEPSSVLALGSGLVALGGMATRRRRR